MGMLWSKTRLVLTHLSHCNSNPDNVLYISVKDNIAISSFFFFFLAMVFEVLFGEDCEKEKKAAVLDM